MTDTSTAEYCSILYSETIETAFKVMHNIHKMKQKRRRERYVAFPQGIKVGGHHKVQMAELRKIFKDQFLNILPMRYLSV